MMGCGIGHFGRRGLETTQTDKIWSKIRNPYRCRSKPLVAPRVQTPKDKILDQILSV